MFELFLIRSGETEYDEQGRIQGTLDVPLSEDGRREADEVVKLLSTQSIEAIFSSPCQSATYVAEALGQAMGIKPKEAELLHNLDHGLWQGMLVDDVKAKQPKVFRQWLEQPETVCPPEGETINAAKARVAGVLAKMAKKYKEGDHVAIVVPEPLASVVRHVLRMDELGDLWHSSGNGKLPVWECIPVEPRVVTAK